MCGELPRQAQPLGGVKTGCANTIDQFNQNTRIIPLGIIPN
jgi:hypothetical protein